MPEILLYVLQLSLKTEREKKREKYFPMRKYAIKA
jgi:large subunit ribosomal protein L35e